MNPRRNFRNRSNRRLGTAMVELAVCLPVLVIILIGTVEACRLIQIEQDLSVIAYEGARVGTIPGMSSETAIAQCELMLADRGIVGHAITVEPDAGTLQPGQLLTVTVTVDCDPNSLFGTSLYGGRTIDQSVVMRAQ